MTRTPRPTARILLLDPADRLLLFRFTVADRRPFWCTPGGRVDDGESYAAAARRELLEETGFDLDPGPEVAQRTVEYLSLERVPVWSDERYFLVRTGHSIVSDAGYTEQERSWISGHRWFALDEIAGWPETIFPDDLSTMVAELLQRAE